MATTLTITLNDNGSVSINGPLTNKLLCWGLLVAAQDLVKTYSPIDQPRVQLAEIVPPADVVKQLNPEEY